MSWLLPAIRIEKGNPSKVSGLRNFLDKSQYIQVHQTDYHVGNKPSDVINIKSNYVITEDGTPYLIHPIEEVIVDNYNDFVHIEVSWVSESRRTVEDGGRVYHREPSVWTPEKEQALYSVLNHAVNAFRKYGIEPVIITHRQTYKQRMIDPDKEIAQATMRIAKAHGFKIDYQFVRGSGAPAPVEWYA